MEVVHTHQYKRPRWPHASSRVTPREVRRQQWACAGSCAGLGFSETACGWWTPMEAGSDCAAALLWRIGGEEGPRGMQGICVVSSFPAGGRLGLPSQPPLQCARLLQPPTLPWYPLLPRTHLLPWPPRLFHPLSPLQPPHLPRPLLLPQPLLLPWPPRTQTLMFTGLLSPACRDVVMADFTDAQAPWSMAVRGERSWEHLP